MVVWIDSDGSLEIGMVRYLVETLSAGSSSWSFQGRPADGVRAARVGKVVALGKGRRSRRAQIRELRRGERDAFLHEDGHPELIAGARAREVAGLRTHRAAAT